MHIVTINKEETPNLKDNKNLHVGILDGKRGENNAVMVKSQKRYNKYKCLI